MGNRQCKSPLSNKMPFVWYLKLIVVWLNSSWLFVVAGSQFWNPGLFEVTKSTIPDDDSKPSSSTSDCSSLEVKVGSDLEGIAAVTVSICETGIKQEHIQGAVVVVKLEKKKNEKKP